MSKFSTWFRQKVCSHYHELHNGVPLYDMYPRKKVWPPGYGSNIRYAEHDMDAVICIGCGVRYFNTDGSGVVLTDYNSHRIGIFL